MHDFPVLLNADRLQQKHCAIRPVAPFSHQSSRVIMPLSGIVHKFTSQPNVVSQFRSESPGKCPCPSLICSQTRDRSSQQPCWEAAKARSRPWDAPLVVLAARRLLSLSASAHLSARSQLTGLRAYALLEPRWVTGTGHLHSSGAQSPQLAKIRNLASRPVRSSGPQRP